jgi:hypothetical protein
MLHTNRKVNRGQKMSLPDSQEKATLNRQLPEALADTMAAVRALNAESVVHGDWRVKDIIGHLAAWEVACVLALRAYQQGNEYQITDDYPSEEGFNQHNYHERYEVPADQVYEEWAMARANLKAAINETVPEKFEGQMRFPWGPQGTIAILVRDTIGHEEEHRAEILKLAGPPDLANWQGRDYLWTLRRFC